MVPARPLRGMRIFAIVWSGQLVSLVGSGLSSFVLGLWVFQRTQSATQFALILFSGALPRILLSPLAGALVDRWDRRSVMLLSDVGAGFGMLAIALLYFAHHLAIWQVFLATGLTGACGAFQLPAYLAATTLLVPERQLGRANGLLQVGIAAQDVLAPLLAPVLVAALQLGGVLIVDAVTFFVAVATLLVVRFPTPAPMGGSRPLKWTLRRASLYGWSYVRRRPGLLGLLLFLVMTSFLNGMIGALIYPLLLSFATPNALGIVVSIAGGGMLLSSLMMSAWRGPERRISGVLGSELVFGLGILLIGLRPSVLLVGLGAVVAHLALPVGNVTNQAIWQAKVAPEVQGRVFALRQMVARAATLLAYLLAGPLADRVFDPLLTIHGPLAGSIGHLVGTGPGRGMGLIFALLGALTLLTALGGYLSPRLRLVERELPDASVAAAIAVTA
jgi:MFS family permease